MEGDTEQFPKPKHQDDADLAGEPLVFTPPAVPVSVDALLSPDEEASIEKLEARLRELLAERAEAEGTTDEPVGPMNANEIQRLSVRINELRTQQRKRREGIGEE